MSDENKNESGSESDPLKNIKAEFSRKQENVMNELSQLKGQLSQIADAVSHAASARKKSLEVEVEPDPVSDPRGYKEHIKKEIRQDIDNSMGVQNQKNAILATLVSNYPELQDSGNELTKKTLEIYNGLSDQERSLPSSYKLAVTQAAQEVGVLPVNKRKKAEASDDFVYSGGSGDQKRKSSKDRDSDLDPLTLEFAKALGRPVESKEYLERLKKSQRKSWKSYA